MTGSSSPERTERGFIVLAVLFVALLYFGLILLVYREQSQVLRGVQRYRSRVISAVMAENAVEMAAAGMIGLDGRTVEEEMDGNDLSATYVRGPEGAFVIEADAIHHGLQPSRAHVRVEGRILEGGIRIDATRHGRRALE